MLPEEFIARIASVVVSDMKKFHAERPEQKYMVHRQTPNGPVTQQVSLPQMLAELTDALRVQNDLKKYEFTLTQKMGQVIEDLKIELEENRKLAAKITKSNKRKKEEDEDDDDD